MKIGVASRNEDRTIIFTPNTFSHVQPKQSVEYYSAVGLSTITSMMKKEEKKK